MLNCKQMAHKASDYVDHNVNGWQRFTMGFHLFICVHCRRFFRHLRITRDFSTRRTPNKASDQEVQKVMESIKQSDST